jgi:hypothetical protein
VRWCLLGERGGEVVSEFVVGHVMLTRKFVGDVVVCALDVLRGDGEVVRQRLGGYRSGDDVEGW